MQKAKQLLQLLLNKTKLKLTLPLVSYQLFVRLTWKLTIQGSFLTKLEDVHLQPFVFLKCKVGINNLLLQTEPARKNSKLMKDIECKYRKYLGFCFFKGKHYLYLNLCI